LVLDVCSQDFNPLIYDVGAPLSKWTMNDSYDTAGGCRRGKDALLRPLSDGLSHADTEDRRKTLVQIFSALNDGLQCIATDDPRLNAK